MHNLLWLCGVSINLDAAAKLIDAGTAWSFVFLYGIGITGYFFFTGEYRRGGK